MATTKKKAKTTTTPDSSENKRVGYFFWCGETAMDDVIWEQALPLDCADVGIAKTDLENALKEDSNITEGSVFRITVERLLKGTKPPVVFTKVE